MGVQFQAERADHVDSHLQEGLRILLNAVQVLYGIAGIAAMNLYEQSLEP